MFFFLHKLRNHYNSVRRAKHAVVAHCSEGWYVAVDLPDDYNERYSPFFEPAKKPRPRCRL